MESYIPISQLNDYIFCPRSIYYHGLYMNYDTTLFYSHYQIAGQTAHLAIDRKKYSTRKNILQGMSVYSERFRLGGKIDTYDINKKILTERKKHVKKIYDGYIYQVYAQFYALEEMGYTVEQIFIYSLDDNKKYPILLPDQNEEMKTGFLNLLADMNNFQMSAPFSINPEKCRQCIYRNLCDIP